MRVREDAHIPMKVHEELQVAIAILVRKGNIIDQASHAVEAYLG